MPSPLAHTAFSLAAAMAAAPGAPVRRVPALFAAIVAGLVPDADLVVVALTGDMAWHHGPSHSLVGAAVLGLGVGAAFGLRGRALAWCVVAGAAHPLLDWELGDPADAARFGVPLGWPVWPARHISPWPWFLPFHIHEPGFIANLLRPDAVAAYVRELVFAGVVAAVAWGGRRFGPPK